MASATHRTKKIRKKKKSTKGLKRKAKNRNQGTTKSSAKLFGDE
jgi:hypothetical protein